MEQEKKEFEYYILFFFIVGLVILGIAQVFFRFVLILPLPWTEELSRYFFIAMVYFGMSLAIKRDIHVRVEIIDLLVLKNMLPYFRILSDIIVMIVLGMISYYMIEIINNAKTINQITPALQIPIYLIYCIIPITFILSIIRTIQIIKTRVKTLRGDNHD